MNHTTKIDAAAATPHQHLISEIGTNSQVAGIIMERAGERVSPQSVAMWKQRMVPWKWRPLIHEICAERGIPVPADFLVGGTT